MIAELNAAFTSLGLIRGIAKAMVELKVDGEVQSKVVEIQGAMLDLQTQLFAINDALDKAITERKACEQKLKEIEDWKSLSAGYEEQSYGRNWVVVKRGEDGTNCKTLKFCQFCFYKKQLVPLHHHYSTLVCNSCKQQLMA